MGTDHAAGRAGYLPGLDGIRAIAVGAVVAYHLRVPFFDGGLLGVSVFFTLSGYLITSLLVREFERTGTVELKAFWIRRARRLLPALLLMLPVVVGATAIARPAKLATTAKQALFAMLYVANWTTIARGDDYFQRFTGPGPLDHLWSLAIEEQFYILWPLLVVGALALGVRVRRERLPLTVLTLAFTVASTWAIAHLYDPSAMNNTRAYEGTDARAASLLVGALAAVALPFDRVTELSGGRRVALEIIGALGLVGVLACIARTDEYSPFLYRGGELALAVATVALSVAASHPRSLLARALGVAPLRWLGARSYGIYLWHLPVVAFMPSSVLVERPVLRGLVQLALILALAAASFRLIEDPIRRHTLVRARWTLVFRALVLAPSATLALGLWPLRFPQQSELEALAAEPLPPTDTLVTPAASTVAPSASALLLVDASDAPDAARSGLSSCKAVVHIGDSTSIGLVSNTFLPNKEDQIGARYRAVGVERFVPEISGARSMVETWQNQPNATEIASRTRAGGFSGCWVLALGTNDPANTSGNGTMLGARVDAMMGKIGDAPALWMTTKTLKDKGPYQNANMLAWNHALEDACARHPNVRVYDWASEVEDSWFGGDGIHFTANGYRERGARIARALARAFPEGEPSSAGCFVRSAP